MAGKKRKRKGKKPEFPQGLNATMDKFIISSLKTTENQQRGFKDEKQSVKVQTASRRTTTGACLRFFNGPLLDNEFMPPLQPFSSKSGGDTHTRSGRGGNEFEFRATAERRGEPRGRRVCHGHRKAPGTGRRFGFLRSLRR